MLKNPLHNLRERYADLTGSDVVRTHHIPFVLAQARQAALDPKTSQSDLRALTRKLKLIGLTTADPETRKEASCLRDILIICQIPD
jgi:hypothetical protein